MAEYVITYCSANCQYNSGNGYYNSCKHPSKQNQVPYAGIDRYYVSGCKLQENNTRTPKERGGEK